MSTQRQRSGEPAIRNGIEYYTYQASYAGEDGRLHDVTEEEAQCARCGSSVGFVDCYDCGGEGGYFGEDIASSYDYGWIDEDEWYTCRTCGGTGGRWHCISSPEWCQVNPMTGREHIESTAMPAEAWRE